MPKAAWTPRDQLTRPIGTFYVVFNVINAKFSYLLTFILKPGAVTRNMFVNECISHAKIRPERNG